MGIGGAGSTKVQITLQFWMVWEVQVLDGMVNLEQVQDYRNLKQVQDCRNLGQGCKHLKQLQ